MATPVNDDLDYLFGGITTTRSVHKYADGVSVEILNLGNDSTPDQSSYNGSRVFYLTEDGVKKILCQFPGYSIEKVALATHCTEEETVMAIDSVLQGLTDGSLCLTNDGPLLMIFKVAGKVRIHMMRSANHGFDAQFMEDFQRQYEDRTFEDLFPASCVTSNWCQLFRQGSRTSAMVAPYDSDFRTLLYLGGIECVTETPPDASKEAERITLLPFVEVLSLQKASEILRNPELGVVCYRHQKGEIQLLSENYLRRVATMTGVTMDELISGIGEEAEEVRSRPSVFVKENKLSAKLVSSRFPRTLDLFALYMLCGTNSTRRLATVSGFNVRLDANGKILANPKRGFYNFCRAAGVNPRRQLTFPATPSAMRLAIRRIILGATLPTRQVEMEKQFNDYEYALTQLVPMFVARCISGPAELSHAFEIAFGTTVTELLSGLPLERVRRVVTLRSVRSALLMADHYRLVTVTRFALKHLLDSEFTPSAMRLADLVDLLTTYSKSSRRRRQVAETVNQTVPLDMSEWPTPGDGPSGWANEEE
jgi:hypothetical protein